MWILKLIGAPGSITFLLCGVLTAGLVAWLRPRWRPAARVGLWCLAALYLVLALPVVANPLADGLAPRRPVESVSLGPLDALVIFDGDNRVGRARTAVALFRKDNHPETWVLGGAWIMEELEEAGLPEDRVKRDSRTPTTRDQVAWVHQFVAGRPDVRLAVIASRLQVPRVTALIRAAGLQVPVVQSPIDAEPPTGGLRRFVPSYVALRASRDALYEHAALWYYAWRGWIDERPA